MGIFESEENLVKIGDTVFVKTDNESIRKMKNFFTNDKIIRHIIDNPNELYKVVSKDRYGLELDAFYDMDSKYIPIECVELAQNQALYQIRKESTRF